MNQTLLVELLTEELPPKALVKLGAAFANGIAAGLKARGYLDSDSVITPFATPRRLSVAITRVRAVAPDAEVIDKLMPAKVAFDASGNNATLTLALGVVRAKGQVVNIALWEHPAEIDMFKFLFTEANLTSSLAYANDHAAVIDALASGRIDAAPLISQRIALEDIVSAGLEELINNKDRNVKILVQI